MAGEKFDFAGFVSGLKGVAPESQRDRVREELGRMRELVVREPTHKFRQQIYVRRLERLARFLAGEDVISELTPSEQQAYVLLVQEAGTGGAAEASTRAPREATPAAESITPEGSERRESRRIYMKTRVRIRPQSGAAGEVVEPLNVSRGGFEFQSGAQYALHEIVWTTMHYQREATELETRGIIVRAVPLANSGAFSYGVKFLGE